MPKRFFSHFQDGWVSVLVENFRYIIKQCLVCGESNFEGVDLTPSTKDMSKKKFVTVRCANCKTAIGSYIKKVTDDGRILESPDKTDWDENFNKEIEGFFNESN